VSLTIHIEQFSWAVLPYCEYVQRVSHNLFSFVAFKTYLSPVYAVKRRYCPSLVYIENRPIYTLVLNSNTLLRSFSRNYSQTAWGIFFSKLNCGFLILNVKPRVPRSKFCSCGCFTMVTENLDLLDTLYRIIRHSYIYAMVSE